MATSAGQTIDIVGDAELRAVLRELRGSTVRRVMMPAVRAGLSPINKAAKRLCPSKRIRRLIGTRAAKAKRGSGVVGRVEVREAAKHGIADTVKVDGRTVGFEVVGNFLEFGTRHMPARSFLRPAVEMTRPEALARVTEKARERLEVEARKQAKKGRSLR